ncbi:MAG: prolipoprotein diacylglyceryl transferase, partial [Candidatus Saccharimonadales bacterium]
MSFPVYFHILGHRVHPHGVMEVIAYAGGFQLYRMTRGRWPRAKMSFEQTLWIFVGAVFGALIGSKVLACVESLPSYWPHRFDPQVWFEGKTIVGGLLGGWAGVEIAKKLTGITHSTGDAFVFPLIFGMAVGRVGCFLTGLADHTYGIATTLPWGVDFGDGIRRHPAQLYDIVFLAVLAGGLLVWRQRLSHNGQLFRIFLACYFAWRLGVEFLKPTWKPYLGLSAIQLACVLGGVACVLSEYVLA